MAFKRITFEEQEALSILFHMNHEAPTDAAILLEYAFTMGRQSTYEGERIRDIQEFLKYINEKLKS